MRIQSLLIILVFLLCGLFVGAQENLVQESGKPNILFIAVDDLKPLLKCYGDTLARTPHIDALATKGVTFTRSYCQQAVCAPSRASLLTSRYPDQTRVWDLETLIRDMDPGIVTLPQYLAQNGYRTTGTGKIFDSRSVDNKHDSPSWSVPFRFHWNAKYYDPETGKPVAYFYASPEAKDTVAILEAEADLLGVDRMTYIKEHYFPAYECTDVPLDAYSDGAIANVGIELMGEAANSGDPFFLAVGFQRPHLPFNAPQQFWDLYDREDFTLAPFRERAAESPTLAYHNYDELRSYTGIPESGDLADELQITLIHGYYAATSYIDQLIGNVIARLRELELEDNTIIILWGDHGWHLGDHGLWCKHSNFEEATRTPLIIFDPRQPDQGSSCASPVEFTDIAPTLCELAGLPIPGYFEGMSLSGLLEDPLEHIREGSLSQYPRNGKMGYSLRTERYRYTLWTNSDGSSYAEELYDYQEDSLETINFASHTAYSEIRLHLDSLVRERIGIPSTQERITFEISAKSPEGSSGPLAGASITLAGETRLSAADGTFLFTHPSGTVNYLVEAEGYVPVSASLEIDGPDTISIHLEQVEPIYQVTVSTKDFHTGRPLINTLVSMDEEEQGTDFDGNTTFQRTAGTYQLQLSKDRYPHISESCTIAGDTTLKYRLEATLASIKIKLLEGNTPVNNASITVGQEVLLSNSLGISIFEMLATGMTYQYSIEKEAYHDLIGSLLLLADTTINLQAQRFTGTEQLSEWNAGWKLWPNPADQLVFLSHESSNLIGPVEVTDFSGRIVMSHDPPGQPVILEIGHLPPGIYGIRWKSSNTIFNSNIIKQ